jgi:polyisoprenyl-phosphate glycosyltransferase
MLKFAMDGITSFSGYPLRLAAHLGFLLSLATMSFMVGLIVYKMAGGTGVIQGWTSLIVTVLFLGGLQLMAIGVVGEYMGRVYEEVKRRPLYLVDAELNVAPRATPSQTSATVVFDESGRP